MGFSPLNGEVILKEDSGLELGTNASFSPLNGEVILKAQGIFMKYLLTFQFPQWGSNSKDGATLVEEYYPKFQSPQWGSNSKVMSQEQLTSHLKFQSPQWGSNSKGQSWRHYEIGNSSVSVPSMGK